MSVTFIVEAKGGPPLALLVDLPLIHIGRGEACDVSLPDPSVSTRHAVLRQHGDSYVLTDDGSANGTFVGTTRLQRQAGHLVQDGDRVRFGQLHVTIHLAEHDAPATDFTTRDLALALMDRHLRAHKLAETPRIVVKVGPDKGRVFELKEDGKAYVIGRDKDADFPVVEANASRRHLTVTLRDGRVLVRDLASRNGIELAGAAVYPGQDVVWRPGEPLRLGEDSLIYENAAATRLLELQAAPDPVAHAGDAVPASAPVAALPSPPTALPIHNGAATSRAAIGATLRANLGNAAFAVFILLAVLFMAGLAWLVLQ